MSRAVHENTCTEATRVDETGFLESDAAHGFKPPDEDMLFFAHLIIYYEEMESTIEIYILILRRL
jgi:hypothetical protein